jgi:hypothetical protein
MYMKTIALLKQDQTKKLNDAVSNKKLTMKQARFVRYLLENPKASATAAALFAYDTLSVNAAAQIGSDNLRKDQVMAVLNDAAEEAESVITSVMRVAKGFSTSGDKVGAAYATVARAAANDVLDRIHGKPTQRTESTQAVININMDLTGTIN